VVGTLRSMARVETVTITDDLDGSAEDVITCAFGLGNSQYLIDLGPANREELETFLDKFIQAARPVKPVKAWRGQAQPARKVVDRDRTHEIRQWALDQGLTSSARGRISKEVTEAYEAAH